MELNINNSNQLRFKNEKTNKQIRSRLNNNSSSSFMNQDKSSQIELKTTEKENGYIKINKQFNFHNKNYFKKLSTKHSMGIMQTSQENSASRDTPQKKLNQTKIINSEPSTSSRLKNRLISKPNNLKEKKLDKDLDEILLLDKPVIYFESYMNKKTVNQNIEKFDRVISYIQNTSNPTKEINNVDEKLIHSDTITEISHPKWENEILNENEEMLNNTIKLRDDLINYNDIFKSLESINMKNEVQELANEEGNQDLSNNNLNFNENFNNYLLTKGNTNNKDFNNEKSQRPKIENDTFFKKFQNGAVNKNIFKNNPSYNLSSRLVNDEKTTNHTKFSISNKIISCKFIDEVKTNAHLISLTRIIIPLRKFLQMKDDTFLIFMMFCFDNFDNLKKVHKLIHNKMKLCLRKKYADKIALSFKEICKNELQIYEYYFSTGNSDFEKHKRKNPFHVLNLFIKSKIISNSKNVCCSFSFIYRYLNKAKRAEVVQTWKFDLKSKTDITFWIASEAEEYEKKIIRHCYVQPILSYSKDDYIQIKISVFSENGIIDFKSFRWSKFDKKDINPISVLNFEKIAINDSNRSMTYDDRLRICNLEFSIHIWKNEKSLSNHKLIDNVDKYFKNCFKIVNLSFDDSLFYIFKVKMLATSAGIIKRNKYFDLDIIVLDSAKPISNETQCLQILNFNNKNFQVRMGEYILFYFTELFY